MENAKDKCVLLKNKEYANLLKKANEPKSDLLKIHYTIDRRWMGRVNYYASIDGNINLGSNLSRQIKSIANNMSESICKEIDIQGDKVRKESRTELIEELKDKNLFELRKWLKQQ